MVTSVMETSGGWLWLLGTGSVIMFIGSLALVPLIVVRMPADYFSSVREEPQDRKHPTIRAVWHLIRNVVGLLLVIAGIAMLVLPGQGVLTIFIGLMLTTFPGRKRVLRRAVSNPWVHLAINRLRQRRGHKPLILD